MDRYIQLDEEGYFHFDQTRVTDPEVGYELLKNLQVKPLAAIETEVQGKKALVEAFDDPLVVYQLHPEDGPTWTAQAPYNYKFEFSLETLRADEWDRFHGYDQHHRPFVLSRSAQADFFNLVEEFDDDSVTYQGVKYPVGEWLQSPTRTKEAEFWSQIYQTEERPGWELQKASPPLTESWPQLKLPRSRVLVPGCGSGNDAAYLAQQGHIVTAVDYAPEALEQANSKYGNVKDLKFVKGDFFQFAREHSGQFDVVFEHTLLCAVPMDERQQLIKAYNNVLTESGFLLGVFLCLEKKDRPPFGATEWEIRQRLKKYFDFRYWTRWKQSENWRKGVELVVLAQKKGGAS